ncbi:fatty acid elongation [Aureococcus anophagefferens]|uniref:Elongation of fatty acids protein n=1 Tax=Aureococcus anophagefferens TaxID=44056 RepID=A0ABR1FQF7_AURAN
MTDYEAIGDQIIAWALVGSDVTDEPVKARSGARRATRSAARARNATRPWNASPAQLIMRAYPGDGIKLYGVAFLYNIAQVMLCSYMCIEAVIVAKRSNFNLVCNSYDAKHPPMANVLWLFYASKVLDFVDTFFIVIGKKWKQLSFLHVYHHTTIFLFYWLNLHVNYDGDIYLTIVLNGAIHTIMYYFVSMHTRDIWWKKYLTLAQLVQFTCMNAQAIYMFVTGCSATPPRVTAIYFVYIISLFILFLQFFMSSYVPKKKKQ